jgi:hypothetical protein
MIMLRKTTKTMSTSSKKCSKKLKGRKRKPLTDLQPTTFNVKADSTYPGTKISISMDGSVYDNGLDLYASSDQNDLKSLFERPASSKENNDPHKL